MEEGQSSFVCNTGYRGLQLQLEHSMSLMPLWDEGRTLLASVGCGVR